MATQYDVAVIGGGPAGSTLGTLLKKYNPRLSVGIFERERFPRDHVGESQLPVISAVLVEMEAWDKIEAAGFPVKIGATYRWGSDDTLWDFNFLPDGIFHPASRPAKYAGQRQHTAFQVDRAVYDKILLDHAKEFGCRVREETAVRTVRRTGDRVDALVLADGTEVTARYYVDASGHAGLLRRAMEVETESPTSLQNIAIWEYWRNAEWAVTIGVGGTRVQVLSLPHGWMWFIPLGPDRTSLGLIVPASYYKASGKRPQELYEEAITSDPVVSRLLRNATREGELCTTKDWSFISERLTGENWFLAGESAGFADPILAAGMSLAHLGARDVAYVILAIERNDYEPAWLKNFYCTTHRAQIGQHIRFADFWYTANGAFSDLKDQARDIAADAGLKLTSEDAWRWLGQGGFIERNGGSNVGGYGLPLAKKLISSFTGDEQHYEILGKTHFRLDLTGAERDWTAEMAGGRITRRRMYRRDGKILPMVEVMGWLAQTLKEERSVPELLRAASQYVIENNIADSEFPNFWSDVVKSLEVMVSDGWVIPRTEPGAPPIPLIARGFSRA